MSVTLKYIDPLYSSPLPSREQLEELCDLPKDIECLKNDLENRKEDIERKLKHVEYACITDYMKEGTNINDLHQRVVCCDTILERLETMLCKFQADLGNICQDILSLQDQSVSLSIQLQNKRAVREKLGQFIDDMTIPQPVVNHIMNTPANEQLFMEHLQILDEKITFFKEQDFRDAKSCNDVHETLMSLKTRAAGKVREYILKKINSCKKCLSNYQIPQNSLLKSKFFYRFLLTHERERAREIQNEYIDTMSKVYFSYFKEYLARIVKLEYDDKPDEHDLMGGDDLYNQGLQSHGQNRLKNAMSMFQYSSKSHTNHLKNRSTVFTMGQRATVIQCDLEAPLILPHVQAVAGADSSVGMTSKKYPSECLFRSVQYALVDNACREYLFLCEFFMVTDGQASELFNSIFSKTLVIVHNYVVEQFKSSYDTIAMFLCLHVIYRYRRLALKQNVPILESYWDSLVKCLWPRFDKVFRLHIESVRNCDPTQTQRSAGTIDKLPHPVVRRYAEFACSMSAVNSTFPDERVMFLLTTLQTEVKNFILRAAAVFVHPKEQLIFMINNYDHILSVFKRTLATSSSSSGKSDVECKDIEDIKILISKRTQEIVEELLYPHFGSIICFVKDCEVYLERNDYESLKRNEPKVTPLVKSFNSDWRKALEEISHEIMESFSNFENGNNIQQAALTQIIQYYHRLQKIVALAPFKNNPVRNELVDVHQLMMDVKKYKTNF